MKPDIKIKNKDYYDGAYSSQFFFKALSKLFLSYDQLSKTRRNLKLIRKIPIFSKTMWIMDYGFGHGTLLLRMPRRHQLFGSELSAEAMTNMNRFCALLRREVVLYNPDQMVENANELTLDLVCCSHVLEHVDDENALLNLFKSMLRPEGFLLLNLPINEVWVDPKHVRRYSIESTRQLLESVGFKIESMLAADRWSAFILHYEYVLKVRYKFIFKLLRLILALMPVVLLDASEKMLPKKYECQQLLVLARKV